MCWSGSPWQPLHKGQTTSLATSTSGIAKKNKRSLRLAFFHSLVRLPVSRCSACQLGGWASSCGQRHQASREPLGGVGEDTGRSSGHRAWLPLTTQVGGCPPVVAPAQPPANQTGPDHRCPSVISPLGKVIAQPRPLGLKHSQPPCPALIWQSPRLLPCTLALGTPGCPPPLITVPMPPTKPASRYPPKASMCEGGRQRSEQGLACLVNALDPTLGFWAQGQGRPLAQHSLEETL